MTPSPQGVEPWMPNGFPPPSFVVDTERTRTRTFAGARGRWLAAAAILGALLLIAGILLIARDDDKTDVATGPTSTLFGGTNPTFPDSSVLDPTATLPDATTVPGGVVDPNATTIPGGAGPGTTAASGATPAAAPGVLAVSPGAVDLGRVQTTASGKATLRNTGASPLTFTSSSELPGALTLNPATASIGPGGATDVTITLDAAKVGEGDFSRAVGFSANGAIQRVTVTAKTVRPPSITPGGACPVETPICNKQIQITKPGSPANASPCTPGNTWRYRVTVADESLLTEVKAEANPAPFSRPLKSSDGTGGTQGQQGAWSSDVFDALPPGTTFKFTIVATDQHQGVTRGPEGTIECPPAPPA